MSSDLLDWRGHNNADIGYRDLEFRRIWDLAEGIARG